MNHNLLLFIHIAFLSDQFRSENAQFWFIQNNHETSWYPYQQNEPFKRSFANENSTSKNKYYFD